MSSVGFDQKYFFRATEKYVKSFFFNKRTLYTCIFISFSSQTDSLQNFQTGYICWNTNTASWIFFWSPNVAYLVRGIYLWATIFVPGICNGMIHKLSGRIYTVLLITAQLAVLMLSAPMLSRIHHKKKPSVSKCAREKVFSLQYGRNYKWGSKRHFTTFRLVSIVMSLVDHFA